MIRLLLVDDHVIIRDGLRSLLKYVPDIRIAAECNDGDEVLPLLQKIKADVILMDINMKKLNGIEATKRILARHPAAKILMLTMFNEKTIIAKAIRSGALGVAVKSTNKEELIRAIRMVNRRIRFFSDEIPPEFIHNLGAITRGEQIVGLNGTFSFTEREITVLRMVGQGMTNAQIGEVLKISKRTAECHRNKLLKKVGVKNSIELIKFAADNALIE